MIGELAGMMVAGPSSGDDLEEALAIFERLGDRRMLASVQANLGFLCAIAGRWEEGTRWFGAAREAFTRVGDVVRSTDPALNLGEMLVKQRRYDEAEPILRDAIRVLRSAHFTEGVNRGEIQLARIMIERQQFAEADAMLSRVQHEFASAGQVLAALEAAATRAHGRLASGDPAAALALLEDACRNATSEAELLLPVLACARGRILGALGRFDEAESTLGAGLTAARAQRLPYEEAMLLEARLEVADSAGRPLEAADADAARRILDDLGVR
jgi:tetratricopeptide (TPR) repeat protein